MILTLFFARAIVQGTDDPAVARTIYAKYAGPRGRTSFCRDPNLIIGHLRDKMKASGATI
jgi:hypothetical protein